MIYSPREKLQNLRKHYKISQVELVGNKISRSHLAMIETGKTKLNKKMAQILVNNFNEILENRGISERVTLDYIIEDTKAQITKRRAYYIEVLNKKILNDDLIFEIENFIKISDIVSKVVLYSKIGDYFYNEKKFEKAFLYYSRTFDEALIMDDSKILENLVLRLSSINRISQRHINNVNLEKSINDKFINFNFSKLETIFSNFVASFSKVKNYDKALFYLNKLLKETEDSEKIYFLKLQQAKLYEKQEVHVKAISIYRGMLLKYNDEGKKFLINLNLMKTYKLKGELSKVTIYYRKNIAALKNGNFGFSSTMKKGQCIYYEMGLISIYLDKANKALEFFKKAVDMSIICDEENLSRLIKNILKLATMEDFNFIKKIENLYFDNVFEKKMFNLGYLFINYYKEQGFESEADKFLNRIMPVI